MTNNDYHFLNVIYNPSTATDISAMKCSFLFYSRPTALMPVSYLNLPICTEGDVSGRNLEQEARGSNPGASFEVFFSFIILAFLKMLAVQNRHITDLHHQ